MKESAKNLGTKAIALVVLIFAAFILFKVVLGVISGILWTVVGIVALVAVIWGLNRLL